MKDKKVLITGGAGFIGSNLAHRLIHNNDVTLTTHPKQPQHNLKGIEDRVSTTQLQIERSSNLDYLIHDKDYLFHFAWQTDLERSMQDPKSDISTDILGLVSILEDCKRHNPNIKIIFPSTVTVIGEPTKTPSDEDEKETPSSIYDANKLMAEKYLSVYFQNQGIRSTCLRLSNVFGERQSIDNPKRGVLNFMIGKALRGENLTVFGDGKFVRDYCYVQNHIDAFLAAAESENTDGEVYVLGSGEGRSFNEVVKKIQGFAREIYDKEVKITHFPFPEGTHGINKRNYVADYSKFQRATGWTPRIGFDEALKRTMEFYKND